MEQKEYEHRLTVVEDRAKSNSHRLDEMEKRQDDLDELVSTVKVLAVREENVETDIKEIKKDVKTLTNKPGQKWDKLVETIFLAIAGAFIGFILAKLGL